MTDDEHGKIKLFVKVETPAGPADGVAGMVEVQTAYCEGCCNPDNPEHDDYFHFPGVLDDGQTCVDVRLYVRDLARLVDLMLVATANARGYRDK